MEMYERTTELPFTHGSLTVTVKALEISSDSFDSELDQIFRHSVGVANADACPLLNGMAEKLGDDGEGTFLEKTFELKVLGVWLELTLGCSLDKVLDQAFVIAKLAHTLVPEVFAQATTVITSSETTRAFEATDYPERAHRIMMGKLFGEGVGGIFADLSEIDRERGFAGFGGDRLHHH